MADIQKYSEQTFESIKHINEYGQEFWYARELQTALEYTEWRNFKKIIDKAKDACATSGNPVGEHFVEVNKSSPMPNGGVREVEDFMLSRYACYLIVMNGDPRKEVIAVGQTYFAIKTRQQELVENYDELTENQKRIAIRHEMAEHNKSLAEAAQMAGVETSLDYATFQNYGYMGLYGGLRAADIKVRKGLKKSQNILDHMGSTELAANLFRATQTDEKLRRDNVQGKAAACDRSSARHAAGCFAHVARPFQYRRYTARRLHHSGTDPGGVGGCASVSWFHLLSSSLVTARNRWRALSKVKGTSPTRPSLFLARMA